MKKRLIKKYVLRFELLLILCIICAFKFKYSNDCRIEWKKNYHVKKADFKGTKVHKGAVASTVYSIHTDIIEKNEVIIASIKTFFLCDKSWVLKDSCGLDVIVHEQKHFDIAELFARKLRKSLKEMTVYGFKDATRKLDSLYKITSISMDIYQDAYDNETEHSVNLKEQKKWNDRILKELNAYNTYSDTDFKLELSIAKNTFK